ncbi:MAG: FimV/HubP family polar landmark protein [Cytophagales bacterium]|nr:FimV/HubP family polar landmark protein [Cytophagales bacterium]
MKTPIQLHRLALFLGLTFVMGAQALTFGRMSVLSFLNQPLIAEIEIPDISAEEANSIRVGIASRDAYKSAGLDYSETAAQLSVTPKRRADGRAILEVRSVQPITTPYLDVVLEIAWNAGRMVRDYTVLLDPPATSSQALVVPAPTLPIQLAQRTQPTQAAVNSGSIAPTAATESVKPKAVEQMASAEKNAPKMHPPAGASIKIKRGDTAAAIASVYVRDGVSLDQMLVAMLRSNPDAFVGKNVNRLKAGVVLSLPSDETARSMDASAAKSSVLAQARDFNEYRRKLSNNALVSEVDSANRSATGRVVATVTDKQSAPVSADRLTLAKPKADSKAAAAADSVAQERAAADSAARATELKKNMDELSRLTPASSAASTPASDPVPTPASAPVPVPAPAVPIARPAAIPVETSLLDQVIASPWTLPVAGGVGILILLAGWLGIRRRRASAFGATPSSAQSVASSQQSGDTIFGPVGASDVDTHQPPEHAALAYAPQPSRPVTAGVDPIAEAEVYLAYNRDVQAEEILKTAKLDIPNRTDIRMKLLEVYAKRGDVDAFNTEAQELHLLTDGTGDDWAQARQLARDIHSEHPLFYAPSNTFAMSPEAPDVPEVPEAPDAPQAPEVPAVHLSPPLPAETVVATTPASANSALIDFDLSNLSLDLPNFNEPITEPIHTPVTTPINAAVTAPTPTTLAPDHTEDPRLALAEEYLSIGDAVGARAIIEEIIQQNTHPQTVIQAHQMLARLG